MRELEEDDLELEVLEPPEELELEVLEPEECEVEDPDADPVDVDDASPLLSPSVQVFTALLAGHSQLPLQRQMQ